MDDITPQVLPTNSIDAETSIIDPVLCSLPLSPAESIVDLYSVDGVRRDSESKPFLTKVTLFGPKGVTTNLEVNIDDGAMINALDYDTYCKHSRRLQTLQPSSRRLWMADGHVEHSKGIWEGSITRGNSTVKTRFEVFPSGANWKVLLGKLFLELLQAVHDYSTDEITFPFASPPFILFNQHPHFEYTDNNLVSQDIPIEHKTHSTTLYLIVTQLTDQENSNQQRSVKGDGERRQVFEFNAQHKDKVAEYARTMSTSGAEIIISSYRPLSFHRSPASTLETTQVGSMTISNEDPSEDPNTLTGEIPDLQPKTGEDNIWTRHTDTFNPKRVARIQEMIQIGDDLTAAECTKVRKLIDEFADTFATEVSEVNPRGIQVVQTQHPTGNDLPHQSPSKTANTAPTRLLIWAIEWTD
jgi:hypothetical protein